jgi:DNA-binding response OmpR family regulator
MSRRILIVDDEPEVLAVCKEIIEAWGYETVTAVDVAKGIKALQTERIDLVLSDFHTPLGCGLDIIAWVRAKSRTIPVFIMSGSWLPADRFCARRLGALAFDKPFDWKELRAAVEAAIGVPGAPRASGRNWN